ncbi:hypothetical protein AJ80_07937 [Polytolypa hystricis UAMH7299]|uniref:JmjC domain-containing protein n=1 Tax=Polytolypa hystricis (strain UAMH7299) TaxID=1447883 RepID=A0A2B7XFP6_POLH7|nr:hypothetical protein AJ80_07937 [Polytolypa hystricis UAMH7299]
MAPQKTPRAAFEPISPDLDLAKLVETTPNFEYVVRIHCDAIDEQGIDQFEKLVLLHVIIGGKPLVIEGYQDRLEKWIFGLQWLKDNHGTKVENARNLTTKSNLPLSIGHYLGNMPLLTNQWTATNYKDTDRQRIYLKDIDCPPVWQDKLKDLLPPFLFYFNESSHGDDISKAGDLMSCLPPEMRAENLMSYVGHEGTYTPAHREMCATLGHNIMVETSTGSFEDGKRTKPGSSIWFMTETNDRHLVSEYWLSTLGHDIEIENHFAQINAWKAAPFKTYVVEQRVGDFILIPPLAPHQVWNRGTRTMKVAWNRTTVETLEMALSEALPKARVVCRDEQYKNKAMIYYALSKYSDLLNYPGQRTGHKVRQLQKDFRRLFSLFSGILLSEMFSRNLPEPRNVEYLPFDSNVTCSFCRSNIFNRFLTCTTCVGKLPNGDEDTYDICMECYSLGRSCACVSKLKWVEQFRWKDLVRKHEVWRNQILQYNPRASDSLQPLLVEHERLGKKPLAEICQEELKRRPFNDITKPVVREEEDEVVATNDDGRVRKRRKIRRSEKFRRENSSCHICKTPEPVWKLATCSSCQMCYCYGSLYRAFDISPRIVLEDPKWKCPRCQKICSCAACRKDPSMKPFEPNITVLGHDTSKVADPRSVETLVNFRHSNLLWLKKAGDHPENSIDTRRLQKRFEEAEKAKSKEATLDENYVDPVEAGILRLAGYENIPVVDPSLALPHQEGNHVDNDVEEREDEEEEIPIDPALMAMNYEPQFVVPSNAVFREEMSDRYQVTEAITFEFAEEPTPQAATDPQNPTLPPIDNVTQLPVVGSGLEFGLGGTSNAMPDATIIQSDVMTASATQPLGVQKRLRKEKDDDFAPRKRKARNVSGPRRAGRRAEEGFDNPSGEENGNIPATGTVDSAQPPLGTRKSSRRISTRRSQPQVPDEPPSPVAVDDENHVIDIHIETTIVSPRAPPQQRTSPQQVSPRSSRPASKAGAKPQHPAKEPQPAPQPTEAEKNRKAKMMAMEWAHGNMEVVDGWSDSD